jgi:hypothetical protein
MWHAINHWYFWPKRVQSFKIFFFFCELSFEKFIRLVFLLFKQRNICIASWSWIGINHDKLLIGRAIGYIGRRTDALYSFHGQKAPGGNLHLDAERKHVRCILIRKKATGSVERDAMLDVLIGYIWRYIYRPRPQLYNEGGGPNNKYKDIYRYI